MEQPNLSGLIKNKTFKMTAEKLFEEYKKLNEVESIKFERLIQGNRKSKEERIQEMKKDVLKKFLEIKDGKGNSFFNEGELKNKLGI